MRTVPKVSPDSSPPQELEILRYKYDKRLVENTDILYFTNTRRATRNRISTWISSPPWPLQGATLQLLSRLPWRRAAPTGGRSPTSWPNSTAPSRCSSRPSPRRKASPTRWRISRWSGLTTSRGPGTSPPPPSIGPFYASRTHVDIHIIRTTLVTGGRTRIFESYLKIQDSVRSFLRAFVRSCVQRILVIHVREEIGP